MCTRIYTQRLTRGTRSGCVVKDDSSVLENTAESFRALKNVSFVFDMADCEVPQEEDDTGKSNSVTVVVENEKPIASEDVVEEKSRSSSIAWSTRSLIANQLQRTREKFRSLKRRSSVENFGQFGFLVPALALFPQADGVSKN